MKNKKYSIDDIKFNIKHNKKEMIFIFLLCCVFGVIIGTIQGLFYKQPHYMMDDTIVQTVNVDSIKKNESYYYSIISDLKEKNYALNAYVQYLEEVNLSGESAKELSLFEKTLVEMNDIYEKIRVFWWDSSAFKYTDKETAQKFISIEIAVCEDRIGYSEQMLEELRDDSFSRPFVALSESTVLSTKTNAENDKDLWENKLKKMKTSSAQEIEEDNVIMDMLLNDGVQDFNLMIEEFNSVIERMEKREQYDIVYNYYLMRENLTKSGEDGYVPEEIIIDIRKNSALIYAKSIEGLDNSKERFCSILTFFVLFGIAVAILYGAFKNKGANNA